MEIHLKTSGRELYQEAQKKRCRHHLKYENETFYLIV